MLIKGYPIVKDYHESERLKLGWVYEKLSDFDRALAIYDQVFREESVKIDQESSCKLGQCTELKATVESLQFQYRIYKEKKDQQKMSELKKLIDYYEKKRVFSRAQY